LFKLFANQLIILCPAEPVVVVAIFEDERRQYGIVDLYGNYIIEPRYDTIRHYGTDNLHTRFHQGTPPPEPIFIEGMARVANDGLWGFVDTAGSEVIPTQFQYVDVFMNGIALVNYNGTWQLIDLYGNILESFTYSNMERLNANLLTFTDDNTTKEGLIRILI